MTTHPTAQAHTTLITHTTHNIANLNMQPEANIKIKQQAAASSCRNHRVHRAGRTVRSPFLGLRFPIFLLPYLAFLQRIFVHRFVVHERKKEKMTLKDEQLSCFTFSKLWETNEAMRHKKKVWKLQYARDSVFEKFWQRVFIARVPSLSRLPARTEC